MPVEECRKQGTITALARIFLPVSGTGNNCDFASSIYFFCYAFLLI